jgi:lysophospholipase L1-like esterase
MSEHAKHEAVQLVRFAGVERGEDQDLPPPVGGTLPPFEGTTYPGFFSAAGEDTRAKVNEWIRGTAEFEAVIDIDAALRDPDRPAFLSPTFDSGDHLHPNDAGAQAMARIINLRELTA